MSCHVFQAFSSLHELYLLGIPSWLVCVFVMWFNFHVFVVLIGELNIWKQVIVPEIWIRLHNLSQKSCKQASTGCKDLFLLRICCILSKQSTVVVYNSPAAIPVEQKGGPFQLISWAWYGMHMMWPHVLFCYVLL